MSKGWHKDRKRHSLASKGIKTGRKKKTTRTKVKIPKNVTNKEWLYADFDGDGIRNMDDCRPLDPTRDGVEPNQMMRERLDKLPIYVTDDSYRKGEVYHINSKIARDKAPKARKQMLSMIKTNPGIVGDVERTKPHDLVYYSKPPTLKEFEEEYGEQEDKRLRQHGAQFTTSKKYGPFEWDKRRHVEVRSRSRGLKTQGKAKRALASDTTFHELKHVEQSNRPLGDLKIERERKRKPYEERWYEEEARDYGNKKIHERYKYPYGVYEAKELGMKRDYSRSKKGRKLHPKQIIYKQDKNIMDSRVYVDPDTFEPYTTGEGLNQTLNLEGRKLVKRGRVRGLS